MNALSQLLDTYSRQARLAPALLVVLPGVVACYVWLPSAQTALGGLLSVAALCGLTILLAQLGRDGGKRREPELFESWGGKPSVALLRCSDDRLNAITKAHYKDILSAKIPNLRFPTADEERADPRSADQVYEAATQWLLAHTRDTTKFNLLFRENISYGFRRNLWGLKPLGATVALATAIISTAITVAGYVAHQSLPSQVIAISTLILWVWSVWWIFGVRSTWVKTPADAYGAQLLSACQSVE
jgi:hypothetical protein